MNFEAIPDLLADIIAEQRRTTEAVVGLAQALAGIRAKVEAERAAAQTAKVEKTTKAAVDTSVDTSVDTPATAAEVDYEAAKKAVLALIKSQGREAAVAVLASYNLKSLQDAKPEQWGPIVQSIAKAAQ